MSTPGWWPPKFEGDSINKAPKNTKANFLKWAEKENIDLTQLLKYMKRFFLNVSIGNLILGLSCYFLIQNEIFIGIILVSYLMLTQIYFQIKSKQFVYNDKMKKNDTATYLPKPNDLVTLTYSIMGFDNDTIYSGEEIGIKKYKVDMEELFPGLRYSVKLLKEGEIATFLFPSSLGYGYQGDANKIGVNVPLKCTLTILRIEKEEQQ